MKFIASALALFVLASPVLVHADVGVMDNNFCGSVFRACAEQGFTKDETAASGKKIWADCADVLINRHKTVAGVSMDPKSFDATNCGEYRKAKEKFDAEWAKKHPRRS